MKKLALCMMCLVLFSCGTTPDDGENSTISKSEAATAMSGSADAPDYCELLGWYNDGICDDFCAQPDPDCAVACPPVAQPICDTGTVLVESTDPMGCVFWTCEAADTCPPVAQPICDANSEYVEEVDAQGCITAAYCKPLGCPPVAQPICAQGTELVEHIDAHGCSSFTCEQSCPQLTPPPEDFCPAGQRIQTEYDSNTGCVSGFSCVDDSCPLPTPPSEDLCEDDERIQTQYDPMTGCVSGFICVDATCPMIAPPADDFCDGPDESLVALNDPVTGCLTGFACVVP